MAANTVVVEYLWKCKC